VLDAGLGPPGQALGPPDRRHPAPRPHPRHRIPVAPVVPPGRGSTARRRLRAARVLGVVGAVLMVVSQGRLAAPIAEVQPSWLGLVGAFRTPAARGLAGGCLITGLVLLSWGFLLLVRLSRAGEVSTGAVVRTALLWVVPIVVGPPLMSLDVYSYVAQGEMLHQGFDPYHVGPEFMGGPFHDPVDPRWRAAHAPYGPLALLLSEVAVVVGRHSVIASVVILRVVALASVALTVLLVARMTSTSTRTRTVALVAASPLVLVTLVSAAHHEAVVTVLVVGALAAQQARRPALGVALAAAALADKLPGAVALGALGVLHLAEAAGWRARVRVLARDGLAVLAVWVPLALLVPDPLGWLRALSTPGLGHTWQAPVAVIGLVTRVPESLVRAAAEVVSVLIVGRLLLTVRRRPLAATVGWGLFAVALLGPVLYPWYLAPAAAVLATLDGSVAAAVSLLSGCWGLALGIPLIERAARLVVGPGESSSAGA